METRNEMREKARDGYLVSRISFFAFILNLCPEYH